jgi:dTDP-4-dehydrorhamnose reductase
VRALVTGASGQLGVELLRTVPGTITAIGLAHSELDIGDKAAVDAAVKRHQPDVIINVAAYNAVDDAEKNPELAYRVNATGPGNLARAAEKAGARIIQISTDYVFDGNTTVPYRPDSPTNPLNTYGKSKLAGEHEVIKSASDHLVIRTSWLFSAHGRNFLQITLSALKEGRTFRAVKDQVSVPTCCRGLADVIWLCAPRGSIRGTAHWVDAGKASRYDQALAIREMAMELGLVTYADPIEKALAAHFKPLAVRPRFSVMDARDLSRHLGKPQRHWKDWLRETLDEIYLNQPVTPRRGN